MSKLPIDYEKLGDILNALETYQKCTMMVFERVKQEATKQINMLGGFIPFVIPPIAQDIHDMNQGIANELTFMAESLNLLIATLGDIGKFVVEEENFFITLIEQMYSQLGSTDGDKLMADAKAKFASTSDE